VLTQVWPLCLISTSHAREPCLSRITCRNCKAYAILDLQLPMQSVSITTNVVSSNFLRRGVLDTTLYDNVCQWLAAGRWFSPGALNSFLHQWNWQPRYNWNIVESGVKHHNPNPNTLKHRFAPGCISLIQKMEFPTYTCSSSLATNISRFGIHELSNINIDLFKIRNNLYIWHFA
jgi:hypothetical protein